VKFPVYFIYLIYTGALALLMFILVPRKEIYRLALLGLFYGAIIDVFWILFIGLIGAGGYLNYGPLGFQNIPFMPPVAWTIFFILFLYFAPKKRPWNYLFAVAAAIYSVFFSNVLANLGIFHWTFSKVLFPFGLYLTWTLFVTWSYEKVGKRFIQEVIMNKQRPKKSRLFYLNTSLRPLRKPKKIR